eukprot:8432558-Ditylum_brightwellii.AAC.1
MEDTASLLKTIQKRQWLGNEVTATYSTAHKGFSHFALADLSEDEIAAANEAMEQLAEATHITIADLKAVKTKLAMVPTDPADYIFGLKKCANLVHALFGPLSPLFLDYKMVIKALTQLK